jgi:hypothetical protein
VSARGDLRRAGSASNEPCRMSMIWLGLSREERRWMTPCPCWPPDMRLMNTSSGLQSVPARYEGSNCVG